MIMPWKGREEYVNFILSGNYRVLDKQENHTDRGVDNIEEYKEKENTSYNIPNYIEYSIDSRLYLPCKGLIQIDGTWYNDRYIKISYISVSYDHLPISAYIHLPLFCC